MVCMKQKSNGKKLVKSHLVVAKIVIDCVTCLLNPRNEEIFTQK